MRVRSRTADLEELARLMDAGRLRDGIDRQFRLADARDAVRCVMERRAHGKVVVTVDRAITEGE